MLVKIEARILIFPGTDFHFPSTSMPPGTFLGSGLKPSLHDRRYASAVLGMALCLSQTEFCQKGAQVRYSATYSPVVGQLT